MSIKAFLVGGPYDGQQYQFPDSWVTPSKFINMHPPLEPMPLLSDLSADIPKVVPLDMVVYKFHTWHVGSHTMCDYVYVEGSK